MPQFLISEPTGSVLTSLAEALDFVDFGIALLNSDLHVRFVNRRYVEIWSMPRSLPGSSPSVRALFDHVAQNGGYAVPIEDLPAYIDARIAAIRAGAVPPTEIDLQDGRRLLFRCIPCADGGRMLTYVDITHTKQELELHLRARDAAELMTAEQRFVAETLESQAAYLASLAETADESARRAEEANRQLEHEIAERRQLEAQLRRMATTDDLTGTLNRAQFLELGHRELERARELEQGFAVLMLDIDHFKRINDRYGHQAGDEALKHFVAQLRGGLRGADLLGRLGGEEFAILLPSVTAETAWQVAERLRARVAATPLVLGERTVGITVSIGGAMVQSTDRTLEQILACADAELYAAKHAGRDRVLFADMPVDAPPLVRAE